MPLLRTYTFPIYSHSLHKQYLTTYTHSHIKYRIRSIHRIHLSYHKDIPFLVKKKFLTKKSLPRRALQFFFNPVTDYMAFD